MPRRKVKDLKALSNNELKRRIDDLKKELSKLNAQVAMGTIPKNPKLIRNTKKTIARILTIMRERELEELIKKKK